MGIWKCEIQSAETQDEETLEFLVKISAENAKDFRVFDDGIELWWRSDFKSSNVETMEDNIEWTQNTK